jgi:hypothetical protein
MSSLVDLYKKNTPTTAKINAAGLDKVIIEDKKSDDKTLETSRHGKLGSGNGTVGGYDSQKTYSSQVKK